MVFNGARQVLRTCVGCRKAVDKGELVRLVRDESGLVAVDARGHAGGRGAYLHARRGCLEAAVRGNAFPRAFRAAPAAGTRSKNDEALERIWAALAGNGVGDGVG